MYQFIGIINDEKVPGLASILNYMNENLLAKKLMKTCLEYFFRKYIKLYE